MIQRIQKAEAYPSRCPHPKSHGPILCLLKPWIWHRIFAELWIKPSFEFSCSNSQVLGLFSPVYSLVIGDKVSLKKKTLIKVFWVSYHTLCWYLVNLRLSFYFFSTPITFHNKPKAHFLSLLLCLSLSIAKDTAYANAFPSTCISFQRLKVRTFVSLVLSASAVI